jgi:hypothetical protein
MSQEIQPIHAAPKHGLALDFQREKEDCCRQEAYCSIQARLENHHMKTIMLAIIAVLAGCATEKVYHTQTSNPTGLAVLMSRSARIEGRELVWSCVYQTADGEVRLEQREECGHGQ